MTDLPATEKKRGLSHSTPVEWAVRSLTSLSGIALAIILVTTFVGVIMRYFFHAPILGSNEIIQLVSIGLIMLAMPAAGQREEHVRVDVFDRHIGPWGRLVGDLLSRAIGVYLMYLLGMRSWAKLEEAIEFNDLSNMLLIPYWPFYGLMALGCALFALVMVLQFIDIIRMGASNRD